MCLIVFSYEQQHSEFRLILAANRDEFYDRPTQPASYWKGAPKMLAGRDLRGKGTWIGITETGRLAALTNFRDPRSIRNNVESRGFVVRNLLSKQSPVVDLMEGIKTQGDNYNGFNVIAADRRNLYYYSNKSDQLLRLESGLYGLSNHFLDTNWPKVHRIKDKLGKLLAMKDEVDPEDLFDILSDRKQPPDDELPNTGVGLEWERVLSPIFVDSETYGTRSSTVVLVKRNGRVLFLERSFNHLKKELGSNDKGHETRRFEFKIQ